MDILLNRTSLRREIKSWTVRFPANGSLHDPTYDHGLSKEWNGDLREAYKLKLFSPLRSESCELIKEKPRRQSVKSVVSFWVKDTLISMQRTFPAWKDFNRVLQFGRAAALGAGIRTCRLAIDETGLVFFTPIETRVGDLVCMSHSDSDILIIVGRSRTGEGCYHLLGRG